MLCVRKFRVDESGGERLLVPLHKLNEALLLQVGQVMVACHCLYVLGKDVHQIASQSKYFAVPDNVAHQKRQRLHT